MKYIFTLITVAFTASAFAQTMNFSADLAGIKKDRVEVKLTTSFKGKDTVHYRFPMTIPGTYAVLDYGRYISQLKAYDSNHKALKVKKQGNNTFAIYPGNDVAEITYLVDDSWEEKNKKTKIFEPAGTGFEANKCFYINGGGLFGYFENNYDVSYQLTFQKPTHLTGYTTLKEEKSTSNEQHFSAQSYHQLIDNPILFTAENDEALTIGKTQVAVASYYAVSDSSAYFVKQKIDSAMNAIDQFTGGNLPVDHYAFLNYVKDYRELGEMLQSGKLGVFDYIKLMRKLGGQGFGALEHGNSSSYFLPDFGHHSYTGMLYETAIHEFMHIYAPLSLHSEHIGSFNYTHPIMSKHLWLYEGVTEYFSVLIALQGHLSTLDETLDQKIKSKIISAQSYPDSIPFTVMSANVFNEPYKKYYGQVYERGAIMAMLLDIEIMRLTNGKQTLKTVIFDFSKKYGSTHSFSEETFISEFVAAVHPDLQSFFDRYVTGKEALPIEQSFAQIGISYKKEQNSLVPFDILSKENHVKVNKGIVVNGRVTVGKAEKGNLGGLQAGDKVSLKELESCYLKPDGSFVSDGTMVTIHVERKGKLIPIEFTAKIQNGTQKNVIEVMKNPTPEQQHLLELWSKGTN